MHNNEKKGIDVCIDFMIKGVCGNPHNKCKYYHPSWDKEKYKFCVSKLRRKPCEHERDCHFIHISDSDIAYIPNNTARRKGTSTYINKKKGKTLAPIRKNYTNVKPRETSTVKKSHSVSAKKSATTQEHAFTVENAFNFLNRKLIDNSSFSLTSKTSQSLLFGTDKIMPPIVTIGPEFYVHSIPDNIYVGMHDTSCDCSKCIMIDKLLSD